MSVHNKASANDWITAPPSGSAPSLPVPSFLEGFQHAARVEPDRIALEHNQRRVSYRDLDLLSQRIACWLMARQVETIAIAGAPSVETVAAVLGALRAGAAYVPLDAAYPSSRLAFMLENSGAQVLIAHADLRPALGTFTGEELLLDSLEDTLRDTPIVPLPEVDPARPAYVIYTSGSTGQPKGVVMPHRVLNQLIAWQRGNSEVGDGRTLQFTPLSFDVSFQEMFATLSAAGTLVILDEALRRDPVRMLEFLCLQRVQRLFLPFVALQALCEAAQRQGQVPTCLEEVITAGEQLLVTPAVRSFFRQVSPCALWNHYGPSETHVATAHLLTGSPEDWPALPPIGLPIDGARARILNDAQSPVSLDEIGELYLGGNCLATGYRDRDDLTAAHFTPDPLGSGEVLYRTGDLVRLRSDGQLDFLGRADEQVKIRGYRVEPGEVEVALTALDGIDQAVVTAPEEDGRPRRLVAYLVPSGKNTPTVDALREALIAVLPAYMVPEAWVILETLPQTPSGKIDRRALPLPGRSRPDLRVPYVAARGELEQQLCALLASVFDLDRVGADDDFFDLGGNSILAVRFVASLAECHGHDLPIVAVFEHSTAAEMARVLAGEQDEAVHVTRRQIDPDEPIAIVGMAGRFPGAANVPALWENLCAGQETISFFTSAELDPSVPAELRADPNYVPARGILEDAELFDPAFFGLTPRHAEIMDPQHRVLLQEAWHAMEDAGYDPARCPGPVGVFAGMHNNSYGPRLHELRPDLERSFGPFNAMVANEKDYVATRVAFHLDLRGPAVSVHTACSTSLVAIHQAALSLRAGECDLALAGGVAVSVPQRVGSLHEEGAMFSKDGHCRPFDAEASGTVFSDGAAMVVLRRLSDALEAGDTIHAVLRGSAINNDGQAKSSFTAPNQTGQAQVVATACAAAGVEPTSLGYVEAHGTATPLGDPIEVQALLRVFGRGTPDAEPTCALGSIKSNLGHLTVAAGVAGFIKSVLCVRDGVVPATLHFKNLNTDLDLGGRFHVSGERQDWRGPSPRRAGVSSFGVGGTNAHAIVEEPPPSQPTNPGRPAELFLLSGRDADTVQRSAENLAAHIETHPEQALPDIAFTLHAGRQQFSWRRAVVASDRAELVAALRKPQPSVQAAPREPEVVFVFPGQGAQYPDMGRGLWESEPTFRATLEECARLLRPHLDIDLIDLLYSADADDPDAAARLSETRYTQPALFAIELAVARLWESWGIRPSVCIGHSVGEFVAATLAGVFKLEDALRVVALRGALMQAQEAGAMLSIRAAADMVEPLLPPECEMAAYNGPKLIVASGTFAAVAELKTRLEAQAIPCRELLTSHAFHSAMMEPAVAPFLELIEKLELRSPRVPFISTATGKPITDAEATDPSYWSRHMRVPVRFAQAATHLLGDDEPRVWIESGAGGTTTALIRQLAGKGNQPRVIASLGQRGDAIAEQRALLKAVGTAISAGVQVDATGFYLHQRRRRVSLPGYPFQNRRCWIDPANASVPLNPLTTYATEKTTPGEQHMTIQRRTQILEQVRSLLEDASGFDFSGVPEDTSFFELGLDSLLLTQAAMTLRNELGVDITFRQLNEDLSSMADVTEFLLQQLPAQTAAAAPVQASAPVQAVAAPTFTAAPAAVAGDVQSLINQQLAIMQQQLAVMSGTTPAPAAVAPTPAPVAPVAPVTSPAPAVSTTAAAAPAAASGERSIEATWEPNAPRCFGAQAKIDLRRETLDPTLREALDAFSKRYEDQTHKSKEYTALHRPHLADPRTVSGFRPIIKELVYPIVVNRSKGSRLWDIDGNEYIDMIGGFGINMMGHSPEPVMEAVREQLEQGFEIGPQHPLAGEVAKTMCEMTQMDRAAMCSTGSEAVLGAMRLARTVTGRSLIVMFDGAYHGIFDEVIVRGTPSGRSYPAAPGIPRESVANTLILPYGDDESLRIIRERAHEIAGVLVEPVQSRCPQLQPREFLHELRKITQETESALIFDELITGFRVALGGAQEFFDIDADIATYGKVIASGFPMGMITGKRRWMDALDGGMWQYGDDSKPEIGVTYFAGTFVRWPLALAAAKASLAIIQEGGKKMYDGLNAKAERFLQGVAGGFRQLGAPVTITNYGPLFNITVDPSLPLGGLYFNALRLRGIHTWEHRPNFVLLAHSEEDLATVSQAMLDSAKEMQAMGVFPSSTVSIDPAAPPVPDARLGKDADGTPAWFVPDPERPGKYMRLSQTP